MLQLVYAPLRPGFPGQPFGAGGPSQPFSPADPGGPETNSRVFI